MLYRNVGASFTAADGSMWEKGQEREAAPEDLQRRGYKLVMVGAVIGSAPVDDSGVAPPYAAPAIEVVDTAMPLADQGWPLRMPPDKYLRLHPDGQYAELARALARSEE